jgi:hypothetical protein
MIKSRLGATGDIVFWEYRIEGGWVGKVTPVFMHRALSDDLQFY